LTNQPHRSKLHFHLLGVTMTNDWRSPRQKLQDEYIARIVDNLSTRELVQYAYDKLSEELDEYSDEGLTQQVQDIYPDLLENE